MKREKCSIAKDLTSDSSVISAEYMNLVIEKLKQPKKNRDSTKVIYHSVWKNFNKIYNALR